MADWCIYVLKDPRNDGVRYVGFTGNRKRRLWAHVRDGKRKSKRIQLSRKAKWVKELLAVGLAPVMEVIEVGADNGYSSAEKRWIKHYRDAGIDLVNGRPGGCWEPPPSAELSMWNLVEALRIWIANARLSTRPPGNSVLTSRKRKEP